MLLCNVCHRIVHLVRLYRSAPEELSVAIGSRVENA
jgi:predicted HNH restriction endonuclease